MERIRINSALYVYGILIVSAVILAVFAFPAGSSAAQEDAYIVEIKGEINSGLARAVNGGIKRAEEAGADVIIFSIDTFGGLVESALRIRTSILGTSIPTVAFIEERAWSAGALIAISTEKIVMTPGSSIGAAETRPREEKYISALRGEFKSTAELRGRDPEIAEAMVDTDVSIEGIIDSGKLLTLTAHEALEMKYAELVEPDLRNAVSELGYEQAVLIEDERPLVEEFSIFVSQPVVSILLIAGGLLGLYLEAITPGWALPGTAGVLLLTLFFSGQMAAGVAGFSMIFLFIAGIILLGIEIFVIPGFGITGFGGIIAIFGSLFLSFESSPQALWVIAVSFLISVAGAILAFKMMDRSKAWSRLVLSTSEEKDLGYVAPKDYKSMLDKEGKALTSLRPAGTGIIDGERLDVVTEGDFIKKDERIKVVAIEGRRIIVRKIDNQD